MARLAIALSVVLAGCFATVKSTSSYLTPDQSTISLARPAGAAAAELQRLFAMRSISLLEQRAIAPAGSFLLRLVGGRRYVNGVDGPAVQHAIDSMYYVRIEPTTAGSRVTMLGKPAVDGVEACTKDPGFQLPCDDMVVPDYLAGQVSGYQESQVIRNLVVQLRLEQ